MPDLRAQRVQQAAVVGDQHHRAVVGRQLPAQLRRALRVQIGGRLVGKQQMRAPGQRRGDPSPGLLAAGETLAMLLRVEFRPQPRVALAVRVAHLANDRDFAEPPNGARVGHTLAGEHPQQRGLARAVFADEADPVAVVDFQFLDFKNGSRAEAQLHTARLQQNFGHKKHSFRRGGAQKEHSSDVRRLHAASKRHHKLTVPANGHCKSRISVANNH